METRRKYVRIFLNIGVPLAWILLVCLAGPALLRFFMPFVVGWVIALITNPLVRFLERHLRLVRRHSSVLIMVLALALVMGLGYFLLSWLAVQAVGLARELPELYSVAADAMNEFFQRFEGIFQWMPAGVQEAWDQLGGNVGTTLGHLVQQIASPTVEAAGNVAMRIPNLLVNVVVTILSAYFFLAEREQLLERFRRLLPEGGDRYFQFLRQDVKRLIGGYFLAQFKIMFVVAAILLAGFLVLQVRYSVLLALLVSLLDFLPMFGTGTVLIPWALVRLFVGDYMLALGLVLLYLLTQVVRQMIQPKIVGDSLGLSPLMTLFLLYLGFRLHGLSGMILAVPLGILVLRLYEYGIFDSMFGAMRELAEEVRRLRREK